MKKLWWAGAVTNGAAFGFDLVAILMGNASHDAWLFCGICSSSAFWAAYIALTS